MSTVSFIAVQDLPEIRPGDDLAAFILKALDGQALSGDLLVVTHKVVSKVEGRLVRLDQIEPSPLAVDYGHRWDRDPRHIEIVLRESKRVIRMADGGLIISETHHGLVCAHAGVDLSNVDGGETACLLPLDPDASARGLHEALSRALGFSLPVVISDSFGRPWRNGILNVAIGLAGLQPMTDYRGSTDRAGYELKASLMATADALAAASELVTGKCDAVPVVLVRGFVYQAGHGRGSELIMEPSRNLFP